jgi:hypothetical protein
MEHGLGSLPPCLPDLRAMWRGWMTPALQRDAIIAVKGAIATRCWRALSLEAQHLDSATA